MGGGLGLGLRVITHRPHTSSFLGSPHRVPKEELPWGLWVMNIEARKSGLKAFGLHLIVQDMVWSLGFDFLGLGLQGCSALEI